MTARYVFGMDRTLNGNLPADLDHPFGGQSKIVRLRLLEQIPLGLNRRDSQALVNERVCPP